MQTHRRGKVPAHPHKGTVAPGHPDPDDDVLHGPKDALESMLNGEAVNIAPEDVRKFLELAARQHEDPDLTDMYVEGHKIFGGDGLGITRDQMPQVPKEYRDQMLKEAKEAGISITYKTVDPKTLKPTQGEISARRVGQKMLLYESGKKKNFTSVLTAEDGHILDGHHHWGVASAMSLERPDIRLNTIQMNASVQKALKFLNDFVDRHKIPRQSLSEKRDPFAVEVGWGFPTGFAAVLHAVA